MHSPEILCIEWLHNQHPKKNVASSAPPTLPLMTNQKISTDTDFWINAIAMAAIPISAMPHAKPTESTAA